MPFDNNILAGFKSLCTIFYLDRAYNPKIISLIIGEAILCDKKPCFLSKLLKSPC